ncbi:hypothetical protein BKA64DRAFT_654182 [Cadophora sp. MPI-SDFR-AT-0126]|nr:hypothetical protein BKA64DRAFT_654182 [Leotiomycetes sp. MPI-SDFR-AT-0126]
MSLWNPRLVLDVYPEEPDFTCVGTTQKGLRCRNSFIRREYLLRAGVILDALSEISLVQHMTDEARLLAILRTISWLTLCPRWHQKSGRHGQTGTVTHKWLRIIQSEAEQQRLIRPLRSVTTSSNSTSLGPISPPPTPSSHSPPSRTRRSAAPSPETNRSSASPRQPISPTMTSSSWSPSVGSSIHSNGPASSPPSHTTSTSSRSLSAQSSARPTREHGPVAGVAISGSVRAARDINLNVTINNSQIDQAHPYPSRNSRDSGPAPSTPSRGIQTRTPPPSPPASTSRSASSISSGFSTLVDISSITRNDIQVLLNRIESLETRLLQANNRSSSRSSRASDVSSGPVRHTPSSRASSNISFPSIPQPISPTWYFPSSTQPPPSVPAGPLSISSDSSTSPAIITPPSSSSSSHSSASPVILTPTSSSISTPLHHPPSPPSLPVTSTWSIRTQPGESSIRPRTNTSCYMCRQPTTHNTTAHCRSGCDKTYCALCIGEWISSQLDADRGPSCPFWYVLFWILALSGLELMSWQSSTVGFLIAIDMLEYLFWKCGEVEDLLAVCLIAGYLAFVVLGRCCWDLGLL